MRGRHLTGARGRRSGFTLIEVVVALSILALSLGVLYETFGWSLRRTAVLQQRQTAWLTAQSVLAGIRGTGSLRVGSDDGTTADGLKWQSWITVHDALIDPHSPIKAFEVTIDVSWGNGPAQRVRLQSIETSRVAS